MSITRSSNVLDPFSLDLWDPFHGFPFTRSFLDPSSSSTMARMDWKETPEAHVLKADLPGMKKEEIKVEAEGNVRTPDHDQRESTGENEEKTETWHLVARALQREVHEEVEVARECEDGWRSIRFCHGERRADM